MMKSTVYNSVFERGILTSTYKEDVKFSFKNGSESSIYKLRESARENCTSMSCAFAVSLKVVLVAFVLAAILF